MSRIALSSSILTHSAHNPSTSSPSGFISRCGRRLARIIELTRPSLESKRTPGVHCSPQTQGKTMLQRHAPPIDSPSVQRTLARLRVVALPFVFAGAGVVGFTALPQPTRATDYPWCTQREGAVQCDFTTREQCMQTVSGTAYECVGNPRLIARSLPQSSYGKLNHQRSKWLRAVSREESSRDSDR